MKARMIMSPDHIDEKVAAVKLVAAGGITLICGLTLNEWVAIATIFYMVLQIGLLMPKYYAIIYGIVSKWRSKTP